jgi:dTDP-4-amino-4,6-dideoxygalactose transaminase
MVPFIDLKREWKHFEAKFLKGFKEFGRNGIYILGPYVENFEKDFALYCGYNYAVGVSSGLSALEVSLLAHGVKPGDEVITVANSAVATSLAISNVGAVPVFCDVGDDFLIDAEKIASLVTLKTKAILPVHLFGKPCDMAPINAIAKKHSLEVIEDACQAHGAEFEGEGRVNTKAFSFYPTKNLGGLGEGGMIVTNDEKVRDFASAYRNYGQKGRYNHELKGNNYRLDPLQCMMLAIKLKELDKFVAKRRTIAKRYSTSLKKIKGIKMDGYNVASSFHLFVIRVIDGRRDELKEYLKNKGVDTLVHYPTAIHKQPYYRDSSAGVDLPVTDRLQTEILSLPCYPFLRPDEQRSVIKEIIDFFRQHQK